MKIPNFLNRYTSLPILIDALVAKRLTLRTPASWDDRNDFHYLDRYKTEKELAVLLALCFTTSRERFHHWKCFADGTSGVCIEFDKAKLLRSIKDKQGYRSGRIKYHLVDTVEGAPPPVDSWPFVKRMPFQDEWEFRIIYESADPSDKTSNLPFSMSSIRRITLSPWLAKSMADNVIGVIHSLPDCSKLKVTPSSLLENARWRKAIAQPKNGDDGDRVRRSAGAREVV